MTCNSAINFVWILNGTIIINHGNFLTISKLRWYNFSFILARSTLCILISTFKNVYDTFVMDQMVLRPPDENALNDLEMILHNTSALEYFYDFLKMQDEKEREYLLYNADESMMPRKKDHDDSSQTIEFEGTSPSKKPSSVLATPQKSIISPSEGGLTPGTLLTGDNSITPLPELFQSKFNILCFYMDIRCYESEIRKVRETRAYMK